MRVVINIIPETCTCGLVVWSAVGTCVCDSWTMDFVCDLCVTAACSDDETCHTYMFSGVDTVREYCVRLD